MYSFDQIGSMRGTHQTHRCLSSPDSGLMEKKIIDVCYCPMNAILADLLTKSLGKEQFLELIDQLGISWFKFANARKDIEMDSVYVQFESFLRRLRCCDAMYSLNAIYTLYINAFILYTRQRSLVTFTEKIYHLCVFYTNKERLRFAFHRFW